MNHAVKIKSAHSALLRIAALFESFELPIKVKKNPQHFDVYFEEQIIKG